jgi:hypothetical protein
MKFHSQKICPVCGYDGLEEPAYDEAGCASFEICPCCGIEFGYDDAQKTHNELRNLWLGSGCPWHSLENRPPAGWNAEQQLRAAGFWVESPK